MPQQAFAFGVDEQALAVHLGFRDDFGFAADGILSRRAKRKREKKQYYEWFQLIAI